MKRCKLLLVALGATLFLSSLIGSASARTFSASNQTFRAAFARVTLSSIFGEIRCAVTLEGSLHSRMLTKVANSLVGYVTAATSGTCERGSMTILRETLPWHLRYELFTGSLPNILLMRFLTEMRIRGRESFVEFVCLFTSTPEAPMGFAFRLEAGRTIANAELGGRMPEGSSTCGVPGTLTSSFGTVTVLNAATRITVTLI